MSNDMVHTRNVDVDETGKIVRRRLPKCGTGMDERRMVNQQIGDEALPCQLLRPCLHLVVIRDIDSLKTVRSCECLLQFFNSRRASCAPMPRLACRRAALEPRAPAPAADASHYDRS